MQIKRNLNFKPLKENLSSKKEVRNNGVVAGVGLPIMKVVSCGISTDNAGRIWVITFSRQPKYESLSSVKDGETNYTKLEIFNKEGILIKEIPIKDDLAPGKNCLYIEKNRLFLINSNDAAIIEYKIVNSELMT